MKLSWRVLLLWIACSGHWFFSGKENASAPADMKEQPSRMTYGRFLNT